MADTISKEKRSWNMSHIKSKNTKIEILVRKRLFQFGFRYRINVKGMTGKPDIVLKKYKTVIFVNGCFWHQHLNCKYATTPKSNVDYWNKKLSRNITNDKQSYEILAKQGWHVIILWECELKENFDNIMEQVKHTLLESIKCSK